MPSIYCIEIVRILTQILGSDDEIRQMVKEGASPGEVMRAAMDQLEPELAKEMYAESLELPRAFAGTIVKAWMTADRDGKRFALRSVDPTDVEEFTEKRRVRFVLDYEEDGITMTLTHVAGVHATWYVPQRADAPVPA